MITLTTAGTRRLFNLSTRITRDPEHHQHWSGWRRAHQARARRSHYNRRLKNHKLLL